MVSISLCVAAPPGGCQKATLVQGHPELNKLLIGLRKLGILGGIGCVMTERGGWVFCPVWEISNGYLVI